jgi:uncharacterized membrane protein
MTLDQWLLGLHVTGAFLLLGGAVIAGVFSVLALRSKRPSDIALFLGLTRVAVIAIGVGSVLTLVIGLWLVNRFHYSYGDAWIIVSIVLWVAASAAGGIGGGRDKETRLAAQRLAAEGDAPSAELNARLRDPATLALSWGSGLGMLAVLALMIWKPGS